MALVLDKNADLNAAIKSQDPLSPEQINKLFDGIKANSIEVGGIIIDRNGNKWATPADTVDDLDDLTAKHPLALPEKNKDPNMHYQTCALKELPLKQAEGFVPVTRQEAGLGPETFREYGTPESSLLRAYDTVLIKIPKTIADKRRQARAKIAKEAVEAIEPTEQMLERSRAKGFKTKLTRKNTIGDEPMGTRG